MARPTGYVPSDPAAAQAAPLPGLAAALGAAAGVAGLAAGSAVAAGGASAPPTTRLLRLENLLTEESLKDDQEYAECVEDIRGECERFGTITSFVIPRPSELHGKAPSDVGKCFVLYAELSAASRAYQQLHGRDFDGNKVRAVFLPEE